MLFQIFCQHLIWISVTSDIRCFFHHMVPTQLYSELWIVSGTFFWYHPCWGSKRAEATSKGDVKILQTADRSKRSVTMTTTPSVSSPTKMYQIQTKMAFRRYLPLFLCVSAVSHTAGVPCAVENKAPVTRIKYSRVESSRYHVVGKHIEKDGASTDFVEGLQVSNGWGDLQVVWKCILQVGDEHPELGAPVPHVVQPANVRIITTSDSTFLTSVWWTLQPRLDTGVVLFNVCVCVCAAEGNTD